MATKQKTTSALRGRQTKDRYDISRQRGIDTYEMAEPWVRRRNYGPGAVSTAKEIVKGKARRAAAVRAAEAERDAEAYNRGRMRDVVAVGNGAHDGTGEYVDVNGRAVELKRVFNHDGTARAATALRNGRVDAARRGRGVVTHIAADDREWKPDNTTGDYTRETAQSRLDRVLDERRKVLGSKNVNFGGKITGRDADDKNTYEGGITREGVDGMNNIWAAADAAGRNLEQRKGMRDLLTRLGNKELADKVWANGTDVTSLKDSKALQQDLARFVSDKWKSFNLKDGMPQLSGNYQALQDQLDAYKKLAQGDGKDINIALSWEQEKQRTRKNYDEWTKDLLNKQYNDRRPGQGGPGAGAVAAAGGSSAIFATDTISKGSHVWSRARGYGGAGSAAAGARSGVLAVRGTQNDPGRLKMLQESQEARDKATWLMSGRGRFAQQYADLEDKLMRHRANELGKVNQSIDMLNQMTKFGFDPNTTLDTSSVPVTPTGQLPTPKTDTDEAKTDKK